MKTVNTILLSTVAAFSLSHAAFAEDTSSATTGKTTATKAASMKPSAKAKKAVAPVETSAAPAAVESSSSDFKAGDFMVRLRGIGVIPSEKGHVSNGDTVRIDNSFVPELDFSYFFTSNISAELIAAVTKHDVRTSSGLNAGSSWLLPPTLTLQYHFTQCPLVKPYVGAGVNYTHFFKASPGQLTNASYSDSFGGALQAGVDIPIKGNWYANFDVKKVFISTDAKYASGTVRASVSIDPWIVGAGIGYKF